jgi:hypothetical protein
MLGVSRRLSAIPLVYKPLSVEKHSDGLDVDDRVPYAGR